MIIQSEFNRQWGWNSRWVVRAPYL
ncbi:hypothetical protein Gotur_003111 [Gossypium turneri]